MRKRFHNEESAALWQVLIAVAGLCLLCALRALADQQPDLSRPDNGAFTVNSSRAVPLMALVESSGTNTLVTNNKLGVPRMSSNRNIYIQLRDGNGNERGAAVDAGGSISANVTNLVSVNGTFNATGSSNILVTVTNSVGGGTQYTDPTSNAAPTGTLVMWKTSSNFIHAVSPSKPMPVDPSGVTSPISAASLPLPSGAATAALQQDGTNQLAQILTETKNLTNQVTIFRTNYDAKTPALVSGRVPVDPSGVTSPVSAASWPLPTGAATEAQLQNATNQLAQILDQAKNITNQVTIFRTNYDAKTPALVSGRVPVDPSGVTSPVSAASLPLPSGAATAALQQDGTNQLAQILTETKNLTNQVTIFRTNYDARTPTLGQKAASGSVPVVIPNDQAQFPVSLSATNANGCDTFHLKAAGTTNTNLVKTSGGTLYSITVWSTNAAPLWIHMSDQASQLLTNSTRWRVVMVPSQGTTQSGSGNNPYIPQCGWKFSTGLAIALSTSPSETNLLAVTAESMGVDIGYK